jgi:hypothetical protein
MPRAAKKTVAPNRRRASPKRRHSELPRRSPESRRAVRIRFIPTRCLLSAVRSDAATT